MNYKLFVQGNQQLWEFTVQGTPVYAEDWKKDNLSIRPTDEFMPEGIFYDLFIIGDKKSWVFPVRCKPEDVKIQILDGLDLRRMIWENPYWEDDSLYMQ